MYGARPDHYRPGNRSTISCIRGSFAANLPKSCLDEIQVFREYTGLALRQSCLVWLNSFWFGIPATRGEQGFIGSQCLGRAEIATRPGGTEFELSTPDDYTILGVVISQEVIARHASFPAPPGASAAYATQPVSAGGPRAA